MGLVKEINQVPIVGKYDVIVVGGGTAVVGVAQAIRPNGCKVLIIEKSVVFGGLVTFGIIAYYLTCAKVAKNCLRWYCRSTSPSFYQVLWHLGALMEGWDKQQTPQQSWL